MSRGFSAKRALILSAVLCLAIASPLHAERTASNDRRSYTQVIFNLEDEGYQVVELTSTLLGRVRIVARNKVHLREVVVSRATGEIKSDIILKIFTTTQGDPKVSAKTAAAPTGTGSTGSSGSSGGASGGGTSFSGGVSASVGGSGGVSASVGSGGVSASVGGSGGVSAGVGSGGVSAGVGGVSAGVGRGGISAGLGGLLGN